MTVPFQNIMPFIGVVQGQVETVEAFSRVKVRAYGIHPPVHDTNVPVDSLPWAFVLDPTLGGGVQTNGFKPGEWVFGFFLDGRDAQFPIVVGSIPGMSAGNSNNPWADLEAAAHVADLPRGPHMGGMDTEHSGQVPASGGVETGLKSGGGYDISTPEPSYRVSGGTSINSSDYNGNHVVADKGHVTMHHKSGTVVQISERGDIVLHAAAGDQWSVAGRQVDVARSSKDVIVKGGSFNIRVNGGHINLYSEGNMTHTVRGDYNLKVSGKMNIHTGEQFEVQAAKVGLHAYTDSLNLSALNGIFAGSNTVIHVTAEGDIHTKSEKGNINTQAVEGQMNMKSKEKMMAESTDSTMDIRSKEAMQIASTDNSMDIRSKEAMKLASTDAGFDVKSKLSTKIESTNGQMHIKSQNSAYISSSSGGVDVKSSTPINMDSDSQVYIQSGKSTEAVSSEQAAEAKEAEKAEPEKPTRTKAPNTPNNNTGDGPNQGDTGGNTEAFGPLEPRTAYPDEQGTPFEETEPAKSEEAGDSPSDGDAADGSGDIDPADAAAAGDDVAAIGQPASGVDPNIANRNTPNTATGIRDDFMEGVKAGGITNPNALAAIEATGKNESSFSPNNINRQWADGRYPSGGVMSYNGQRLTNMQNGVDALGYNNQAYAQGVYFTQERPAMTAALNNATSVEQANAIMARNWGYAGYNNPSGFEYQQRLGDARNALSRYR